MPHLTKAEIERSLFQGTTVAWQDAKGKKVQLFLGDPKERRLFTYILSSKTRAPAGFPESFIAGLQAAYDATDDPAKNAENLTDVAVLTAQAVNPYQIAAPIVAHRATFTMKKVVGILYDDYAAKFQPPTSDEISDCGGDAALTSMFSTPIGLVEVVGRSAEPHALNKQYLLIKQEISGAEALKSLDGKPVIAGDSDGRRYFK
jgi:hypothetical protein